MLTNMRFPAYNQCQRMVENIIYNKSIYCKQMHKKDKAEVGFQMPFSTTQPEGGDSCQEFSVLGQEQ